MRREFSVEDVIGHLSVEQNSRAKDSHVKGAEGSSSANAVQKNFHKFKGKNSVQQNTTFKKKGKKKDKKRDGCFTCGSEEHWENKFPIKYKKPGQDSKSVNVTLSNNDAVSGYGNLLPYFQFASPPIGGLTLGPIFMCVLMCLCFLLTRSHEIVPS